MVGRRFPIVHVYFNKDDFVEISSFKVSEEEPQREQAELKADAERRDLTINALFYDPFEDQVLDYVGGLEDLKQGMIRVIGPPRERYLEDPVRMLRVIRHAARTGFEIEKVTWEDLLNCKEFLKKVARERLRDELLKDLSGSYLTLWFKLLKKSGLLYEIYPFYSALEENPLFREEFLLGLLKMLERSEFSLEARVVSFSYAFLPLLQRPYVPDLKGGMPFFERKELLKLFWALFYTFRFNRGFFERCLEMLRDLYKLIYLKLKGREIPRSFRKKLYFPELNVLLERILPLVKKERKEG